LEEEEEEVMRDSIWSCRINPNADVYRIAPKMLWIHYLVSVNHFAECRENWPATVCEMLMA